jgi:23S rRNA pseudouridine955/2504/2580 synthase
LNQDIIDVKPAPRHSAAQVRLLAVDEAFAGQRLDNFLLRELKGVPKTHVYRMIRQGQVRINKGRAHADTRLTAGDMVRVPPVRTAQEPAVAPAPARAFEILYEDDALIALNKPAGVAVHGGSGLAFGVIEQLRAARPAARFLELVHRLDRETSGVLLVAKKRSALTALQKQLRERTTGKTYLALVEGAWPTHRKVLDAPLARYLVPTPQGGEGERRVRVVEPGHPDAMRAVTLVRILAPVHLCGDTAPMTLLAVTIKTGRTHQIRVHLASAGHPIAGDDKYGRFEHNRALHKCGLKRMFLHAWRLRFAHPGDGREVVLQAELPGDLARLLPAGASVLPAEQ